MILSEARKFLFIKGVKVGGTSLEIALAAICGDRDIITPITSIDERLRYELTGRIAQNFGMPEDGYARYRALITSNQQGRRVGAATPRGAYYNHMRYTEVVALHGDIPNDFTVFAISRSPYYKIISQANWGLHSGRYRSPAESLRSDAEMIKQRIDFLITTDKIRFCRNIDRYKDISGRIRTRILRFERLSEDYVTLMQELGVTDPLPLPHAKKGLLSESLNLREYLTDHHIKLINEIYHDEFVEFGYPILDI